MTIDPVGLAKFAGETGTIVGGCVLALKRYINGGIVRIETKLDGHIEKTDDSLLVLKEDVAGVKGYLGIGMPSRNVH